MGRDNRRSSYAIDQWEGDEAASAPAVSPGKLTRTSAVAAYVTPAADLDAALDMAFGIVQRKAAGPVAGARARESLSRAASGSGAPLPGELRGQFERSLQADLQDVRVHTDGSAAEAARSISARAYTTGNHIYFAGGAYDPASDDGKHLLAHEVAHTVQQARGNVGHQNKLTISQPGDALEVEADRAADAMVRGAPAGGISAAFGGLISRDPGHDDDQDGALPSVIPDNPYPLTTELLDDPYPLTNQLLENAQQPTPSSTPQLDQALAEQNGPPPAGPDQNAAGPGAPSQPMAGPTDIPIPPGGLPIDQMPAHIPRRDYITDENQYYYYYNPTGQGNRQQLRDPRRRPPGRDFRPPDHRANVGPERPVEVDDEHRRRLTQVDPAEVARAQQRVDELRARYGAPEQMTAEQRREYDRAVRRLEDARISPEAQRQRGQQDRDAVLAANGGSADNLSEEDQQRLRRARRDMNRAAERGGEVAADTFNRRADELGGGGQLVWPASDDSPGANHPDRIYYHPGPPSRLIWAECKGNTAELGAADYRAGDSLPNDEARARQGQTGDHEPRQRYEQMTAGHVIRTVGRGDSAMREVILPTWTRANGQTIPNVSLNQAIRFAEEDRRAMGDSGGPAPIEYYVVRQPINNDGTFGEPVVSQVDVPHRREQLDSGDGGESDGGAAPAAEGSEGQHPAHPHAQPDTDADGEGGPQPHPHPQQPHPQSNSDDGAPHQQPATGDAAAAAAPAGAEPEVVDAPSDGALLDQMRQRENGDATLPHGDEHIQVREHGHYGGGPGSSRRVPQGDARVESDDMGRERVVGGRPVYRVATGDRLVLIFDDQVDPQVYSTDFHDCAAITIRGRMPDGRTILVFGHVMQDDEQGAWVRLQQEVDRVRALGAEGTLQASVRLNGPHTDAIDSTDPRGADGATSDEHRERQQRARQDGRTLFPDDPQIEGVEINVMRTSPDGTPEHTIASRDGMRVIRDGSNQSVAEHRFEPHPGDDAAGADSEDDAAARPSRPPHAAEQSEDEAADPRASQPSHPREQGDDEATEPRRPSRPPGAPEQTDGEAAPQPHAPRPQGSGGGQAATTGDEPAEPQSAAPRAPEVERLRQQRLQELRQDLELREHHPDAETRQRAREGLARLDAEGENLSIEELDDMRGPAGLPARRTAPSSEGDIGNDGEVTWRRNDGAGGQRELSARASQHGGEVSAASQREGGPERRLSASLEQQRNADGEIVGQDAEVSAGSGPITGTVAGGYTFEVREAQEAADGSFTVAWTVALRGGGGGSVQIPGLAGNGGAQGRASTERSGTQVFNGGSREQNRAAAEAYRQDFHNNVTREFSRAVGQQLNTVGWWREQPPGTERQVQCGGSVSASGGARILGAFSVGVSGSLQRSDAAQVTRGPGQTVTVVQTWMRGREGGANAGSFVGLSGNLHGRETVRETYTVDLTVGEATLTRFLEREGYIEEGQPGATLRSRSREETTGTGIGVNVMILGSLEGNSDTGTRVDTRVDENGRTIEETTHLGERGFTGNDVMGNYARRRLRVEAPEGDGPYQIFESTHGTTGDESADMLARTTGQGRAGARARSSGNWSVTETLSQQEARQFHATLLERFPADGDGPGPGDPLRGVWSGLHTVALDDRAGRAREMVAFISEEGRLAIRLIRSLSGTSGATQYVRLYGRSGEDLTEMPGSGGEGQDPRRVHTFLGQHRSQEIERWIASHQEGEVSAADVQHAQTTMAELDARIARISNVDNFTDMPPQMRADVVARYRHYHSQLGAICGRAQSSLAENFSADGQEAFRELQALRARVQTVRREATTGRDEVRAFRRRWGQEASEDLADGRLPDDVDARTRAMWSSAELAYQHGVQTQDGASARSARTATDDDRRDEQSQLAAFRSETGALEQALASLEDSRDQFRELASVYRLYRLGDPNQAHTGTVAEHHPEDAADTSQEGSAANAGDPASTSTRTPRRRARRRPRRGSRDETPPAQDQPSGQRQQRNGSGQAERSGGGAEAQPQQREPREFVRLTVPSQAIMPLLDTANATWTNIPFDQDLVELAHGVQVMITRAVIPHANMHHREAMQRRLGDVTPYAVDLMVAIDGDPSIASFIVWAPLPGCAQQIVLNRMDETFRVVVYDSNTNPAAGTNRRDE